MSIPGLLDALLILVILAYFSYGWVAGFLRSVFGLAGIAAGGVAAFFAIPLVGSWIPWPEWRLPLILLAVLALIVAGQTLGSLIGRAMARRAEDSPLAVLDRIAGAAINAVVSALVISMLTFSISALGVPLLSQAIAGSGVLRTIEQVTPAPIRSGMAQLRAIVIQDAIPRIITAAGGIVVDPDEPSQPPSIPDVETTTPPLEVAARSVVRVTGTAIQCGQNQSGSGFIVSRDRVVTNAHVVAGVSEPIVEVPGGGAYAGRVVYFDPSHDLAVISVSGMNIAPIPLGSTLAEGSNAVFGGYPLGGPYQSGSARVEHVTNVKLNNIYGENPHVMEVYQLAAHVQEGNSGGPLLTTNGVVVGVIFAKSSTVENVAYAHTMKELGPVADDAPSFTEPVSPGSCVQR